VALASRLATLKSPLLEQPILIGATEQVAARLLAARGPSVSETIWQTATVLNVDPVRWQVELIFKSWKSYLHLASIKTTKEDTTLCYLYGRMRLILLNYVLCPPIREGLWEKQQRELSVLKLVRHLPAFAERWMQAIFQSAFALRHFLQ
jgi:DDE family transposase